MEAAGTELDERRVHVDCVPEHDDVHHRAEGAELVLLAFPIALPQFATPAVKDDTRELVPSLAAVELDQNAPAICFVVNEPEQVDRLDQPAQLLQRACQFGRAILRL